MLEKSEFSWIDEKLASEFKEKAEATLDFHVSTKQIAIWFLKYLREKEKTNEEIQEEIKFLFQKILKANTKQKSEIWAGFNPNDYPPLEFFFAIEDYIHKREFDSFKEFGDGTDWFIKNSLKNGEQLEYFDFSYKRYDDKPLITVFKNEELGCKCLVGNSVTLDVSYGKIDCYSQFVELIKKNISAVLANKKDFCVQAKAFLCYDPSKTPLEEFERIFGNDPRFNKKDHYKRFQYYCKESKKMFKTVEYSVDDILKNYKNKKDE